MPYISIAKARGFSAQVGKNYGLLLREAVVVTMTIEELEHLCLGCMNPLPNLNDQCPN